MLQTKKVINIHKSTNNKNNKSKRRIRGKKQLKIIPNKLIKRFHYKINFFRKKMKNLCNDNNSEAKTNYSENNEENNKIALGYYYKLKKILDDLNSKKIISSVNEGIILDKINEIIYQANKNKINIILDIDQTLVYSQLINPDDINKINNLNIDKENSHYITISIEEKSYLYYIQVRPGLKQFITKLNPFCNFYINSMANPNYVRMILVLLNQKYNLNLNEDGANNVFITQYNQLKTLPHEITKEGNFLILDDNICAWDKTYLPNIIPVKKFYGIFNHDINITKVNNENILRNEPIYQYFLYSNKIYCFNENKRELYDKKNKLPFCCEASWSELNQLNDISDTIIKVYILTHLIDIKICFSFFNIINHILNNCNIFYEGDDKTFFMDLIITLGGNVVNDINDADYILIKDKNILDNNINLDNDKKYKYINIKWLFDTYFSFSKLDVNKYKLA